MTAFSANYIKSISGVAVSEHEYQRLMKALPSVHVQEDVNRDRLVALVNVIKNKYEFQLGVDFDDYPEDVPDIGGLNLQRGLDNLYDSFLLDSAATTIPIIAGAK